MIFIETEEILETGKVEEREAERQDSRERKDSEVWDGESAIKNSICK